MFNLAFGSILAIVVTVIMIGVLWYLATREHNKGKEIGKILLELQVKYPISAFYIFLILLNFAEAFLAMTINDEQVNPVARMITHVTIALISVSAGIVWTKEIMNFADAVMSPWDSPGKAKNIFLSTGLVLITTTFSLGLPIANMLILANGFNQTVQLSIFWVWIWSNILQDPQWYINTLADHGLPLHYSPWQAMSAAMCATIVVTLTHIGIVGWESFKAGRLNDSDMQNAFYSDLTDNTAKPPKEEKKKDEKKDESKDEKKEEDDDKDLSAFSKTFKFLLQYVGCKSDEIKSKLETAEKLKTKLTVDQQNVIAKAFSELRMTIDKLDTKLKDKAISEEEFNKQKKALQEQVKTQLRKGHSHGGLGIEVRKN